MVSRIVQPTVYGVCLSNLPAYLATRFLTEIPHHWRIWRWKVSHAKNSACQDFELCLAYTERLPDQPYHYRSCLLHQFIENQCKALKM